MRLSFRGTLHLSCVALAAAFAWPASCQIAGPVLGYLFDSDAGALRPFWGTPGAAMLGEPVPLDRALTQAAISPQNNCALGIRADDGAMVLVQLAAGAATSVRPVDGAVYYPDKIVMSAGGKGAAVYRRFSNTLQLFTGLPDVAWRAGSIDLSVIPGSLEVLAVDEYGTWLGAFYKEGTSAIYIGAPGEAPWLVTTLERVTAMAFLPGSRDIVVADAAQNKVYLVRDIWGVATPVTIAAGTDGVDTPAAIAVSRNRVLIAGSKGSLLTASLQGGIVNEQRCNCEIKELTPLAAGSVFRLNGSALEAIWMVNAEGEPNLFFIPARRDHADETAKAEGAGQ